MELYTTTSSFEVIPVLGHLERGDEYLEMRIAMELHPCCRVSHVIENTLHLDCRRNADSMGGAPCYFAALQRA